MDVSATGARAKAPAALIRASGAPPNSEPMNSLRRPTCSALARSAAYGTPPVCSAARSSLSCERATMITRTPRVRNARAIARPIPCEAPVTSAVDTLADNGIGHCKPQKFLARLVVLEKYATHSARDRLRVLFLDATHHHAQ